VSDDERIKALEARVQEVERLLRTVVHFNDMTAQTYSYTWHPPLAQGKIYPASGSGGGGQP
jgi:hypothetical protein